MKGEEVVPTPVPVPSGPDRARPESTQDEPQPPHGPTHPVIQPSATRRTTADTAPADDPSGINRFILGLAALAVIALVVAAVLSLGGVS